MRAVDYSVLAAHVLRRRPATPRESGLSRDRGIAVVAQAMREASRARRRRRWWAGSVLTTAVAAAALVTMSRYLRPAHHGLASTHGAEACGNSPAACVSNSGSSVTGIDVGHMDGRDVVPGSVLQADLGHTAHVDFDSGTRLSLEGNTMLAYDEGSANHRFSLSRGSVHLEVAKLKKGQRFLLNTLDAEVEVRGTAFDVAVLTGSNGCAQRTRVSVQEGLVEVRTEAELRTLQAGELWVTECPAVVHMAASPVANAGAGSARASLRSEAEGSRLARTGSPAGESPVNAHKSSGASEAASPGVSPVVTQPASDLAKQNDIYARASAERNLGHVANALALYQELIARYPASALVESASVQRLRLLRQSDRPQATREAKRYLLQFPKGFARAEADTMVNVP